MVVMVMMTLCQWPSVTMDILLLDLVGSGYCRGVVNLELEARGSSCVCAARRWRAALPGHGEQRGRLEISTNPIVNQDPRAR
jgi:hypothetical protein